MSESKQKDKDDGLGFVAKSTLVDGESAFRIHTRDENDHLACRFYRDEFPREDSLVMAQVTSIEDVGVHCSLLEYENKEGLIIKREVSPRSIIRSIHNHVKINRNEVVKVLTVDQEKGFIDLTKRRVTQEEIQECRSYFKRAKAVHGILRHVAKLHNLFLIDLYEQIGWPLYEKYGHAYDAFQLLIAQDSGISSCEQEDPFDYIQHVPAPLVEELKKHIRRRITPKPVKVRSDIDVTCFTSPGIDGIREALLAGIAATGQQVEAKLMASPTYILSTTVLDPEVGIKRLNLAIDVIYDVITEKGGELKVQLEPTSVTKRQENQLNKEVLEKDERKDVAEFDDDDELME